MHIKELTPYRQSCQGSVWRRSAVIKGVLFPIALVFLAANAAVYAADDPHAPSWPDNPFDEYRDADCVDELAQVLPSWSSGGLRTACEGVTASCVIPLAIAQPNWSAGSLNDACQGDYEGCVGYLAAARPGWSRNSLRNACNGADADCVVELAQIRTGASSTRLNRECQR